MKLRAKTLVGLLMVCLLVAAALGGQDSVYETREGLPNVFAKLAAGQDVNIAYLGGSITAQPGYRPQTFQWFSETWPKVEFTQVNAAIGGTGSSLGAFRVYKDVLAHNPDLIFIEFAVNDYTAGQQSIEDVIGALEGIIRQIIKHNYKTDICLVYTITERMITDAEAGQEHNSILAHEKVAAHYGLPSINVGAVVTRLRNAGKLVLKGPQGELKAVSGDSLNAEIEVPVNDKGQIVFSKDGVHPYPNSGHKIYTDTIVNALPHMATKVGPRTHKLPTPLQEDNLEKAQMLPLSKVTLAGDWKPYDWKDAVLSGSIERMMPEIMVCEQAGTAISFSSKGTMVGFYDIMGPTGSVIECEIDGRKSSAMRFDKYCTYYRISSKTFRVDDGVHKVRFTLTDHPINKKDILKQRNNTMDDPARFRGPQWFVGNIMLIGDLVETK